MAADELRVVLLEQGLSAWIFRFSIFKFFFFLSIIIIIIYIDMSVWKLVTAHFLAKTTIYRLTYFFLA